MKKILVAFLIFIASICVIGLNFHKIDSNFYHLLPHEEIGFMDNLQKTLSDDVVFVADSIDKIAVLRDLCRKYDLFSKVIFNASDMVDSEFLKKINQAKIATFIGYEDFLKDPKAFLTKQANQVLSGFYPRILPLQEDFFLLLSQSSLLNQKTGVSLDFARDVLHTFYEGKEYFIVRAKLKPQYKSNVLVQFVREVKKEGILLSGGSVYSSFAQERGNLEGIIMGLVAFLCNAILLYLIFSHLKIFYLFFVVIFSLTFGIALSLLVLDSLYILSLVISVSLIGLLLDFGLHWLCKNHNKPLGSVKEMLGIFLVGFGILSSGYMIFLFSHMEFLRQIAVISIFTILASFAFTYFVLPQMLGTTTFYMKPIFAVFMHQWLRVIDFLGRHYKLFWIGVGMIFIMGFLRFNPMLLEDNPRDYAALPKELLEDSIQIAKITQTLPPTQFLKIQACDLACEKTWMQRLKSEGVIADYEGLSRYFLDTAEQERVLEVFRNLATRADILQIYQNMGFLDAKKFFIEIGKIKVLPLEELVLLQDNLPFFYHQDDSLVQLSKIDLTKLNIFLQKYHLQDKMHYFDVTKEMGKNFEMIKFNALLLKVIGFIIALIILWIFFGLKNALAMIFTVFIGIVFAMSIFIILGFKLDIFAIFGFILASAIGVDYVIFMQNERIEYFNKILSLLSASLTSMISFLTLVFSATYALVAFGMSVSLGLFGVLLFASFLNSVKNFLINIFIKKKK